MINFNNDINDTFLKTISDEDVEDFIVSEDHKKNLFFMGLVLATDIKN